MIWDAQNDRDDLFLETDICVIGAGPAGVALAREFFDSSTAVLVVESGGVHEDTASQELSRVIAAGAHHEGIVAGQRRGLGGTSRVWAGKCLQLDDGDFSARAWLPLSGWPFDKRALYPYYQRAEALLGVPSGADAEGAWLRAGFPRPPTDGRRLDRRHAVYARQLDLGQRFRQAFARSQNVHLLIHATATRLTTTRDGSAITGVELRTTDGSGGRVRAEVVVLCAGAIENPRLLLLSGDPDPRGLANRCDMVGRCFQEHPYLRCAAVHAEHVAAVHDAYRPRHIRGALYRPQLALSESVQASESLLGCGTEIVSDPGAQPWREAAGRLQRAMRERRWPATLRRDAHALLRERHHVIGAVFQRYFPEGRVRRPPKDLWLQVYVEQPPNPDSRITLAAQRDRFGSRLPQLDWHVGELERRTICVLTEIIGSEFSRLGLGPLDPPSWLKVPNGDWKRHLRPGEHLMGTTRMASRPDDGVVDADCQVHGIDGLFIGGGSVFPRGGYANPTLTIVALSIRLADHLKARRTARGQRVGQPN